MVVFDAPVGSIVGSIGQLYRCFRGGLPPGLICPVLSIYLADPYFRLFLELLDLRLGQQAHLSQVSSGICDGIACLFRLFDFSGATIGIDIGAAGMGVE